MQLDSQYIDVKQIAEVLELTEEHVRRLWRQGRLPSPLALRRKLIWDKEFFIAWIRSQHKVPPALGRQLEAFIAAHGGLHLNETTGEYELGDKIDIQVLVYSKNADGKVVGETRKVSAVIPGHQQPRGK